MNKFLFLIPYSLFLVCTLGAQTNAHAQSSQRAAQTPRIAPGTPVAPAVRRTASAPGTVAVAEQEAAPAPEPEIFFSPGFSNMFGSVGPSDEAASAMEMLIREQLARLMVDEAPTAAAPNASAMPVCESNLRSCMQERCGDDFGRCANDSTAVWGDKIESCARRANCTPMEVTLFNAEILADRDFNVQMGGFVQTMPCGRAYNACIIRECGGPGFVRCISRAGGEAAISACRAEQDRCRAHDSGLQQRATEMFGVVRVAAERDVVVMERRLYAIRDEMLTACRNIGGLFDERSLNCIFNLEMHAGGEWDGRIASRTVNAGTPFMCTPEWFGVDVTTFLENRARHDREQRGALGELTGTMYGTATAMVTSGAINRAIDTHRAQRAANRAESALEDARDAHAQSPIGENVTTNQEDNPPEAETENPCHEQIRRIEQQIQIVTRDLQLVQQCQSTEVPFDECSYNGNY